MCVYTCMCAYICVFIYAERVSIMPLSGKSKQNLLCSSIKAHDLRHNYSSENIKTHYCFQEYIAH